MQITLKNNQILVDGMEMGRVAPRGKLTIFFDDRPKREFEGYYTPNSSCPAVHLHRPEEQQEWFEHDRIVSFENAVGFELE